MRFGLRELIFLIVLLAVPAASGWYVFKPRNALIQRAKDEIQSKQAKLEMLRQVSDRMSDIGLEIERGRESLEAILERLPPRRDVEGVLEQVWEKAHDRNLTVKSVKGKDPVHAGGYVELPLTMSMEGLFDGFYQFLLDLEDLARITRIHEMHLERLAPARGPAADDITPGSMKAEFTLSIYFEP